MSSVSRIQDSHSTGVFLFRGFRHGGVLAPLVLFGGGVLGGVLIGRGGAVEGGQPLLPNLHSSPN